MKTIEEKREELLNYCNGKNCFKNCQLHTDEFHCGRGYGFIANPVADDEITKAYAKVFGMNTCEMVLKAYQDGKTYISGYMRYNKEHGFHDEKMKQWEIDVFNSLEEFIGLDDWREFHQVKKMTKDMIERELGYKIEIVE